MKFFTRNEIGQLYLAEGKNWYIELHNDWGQFLRYTAWNWITVRLIQIEFEHERMFWNNYNATTILLGLGFYFAYFSPTEEQIEESEETDKKINAELGIRSTMEALIRKVASLQASQPALASEAQELIDILDGEGMLLVDMTDVTDSPVKLKDII